MFRGETNMRVIERNLSKVGVANILACAALFATALGYAAPPDPKVSTEQIKQAIIRESIAAYPGTCACPYNLARNGSSCGRRSAYSRPGGYAPLCYSTDVTDEMVEKYRKQRTR